MEKQNNRYSLEFKLQAVELSKQRGSLQQVAKELNIGRETLRNWVRGTHLGKLETKPSSANKTKSKEDEDNIRLRKELYEVKLERDILKKTVGIFSKNDR